MNITRLINRWVYSFLNIYVVNRIKDRFHLNLRIPDKESQLTRKVYEKGRPRRLVDRQTLPSLRHYY